MHVIREPATLWSARRSAAVELSPPMLVGHALPPWDARGRSRADGVVRSREEKGRDGER